MSQLPTDAMTQEGMILGTYAYMSPEQAQGQAVDPRSDVFSLGILLFEMATGRRPFQGDNNLSILTAIMRDTPEPVSVSNPSLPPVLSEIVARCLRKDPAKRYADAGGLKEDLGRLQAEVVSGVTSTSGLSVAPARRVAIRRLIWSGVAVAVAILAGALFSWNARRNARIEWARTEAIPRIRELQLQSSPLEWGTRAWEAHELAAEADLYIGDDPTLQTAWKSVTQEISIQSQPPGAKVWAKPYTDPDGEWRFVGRTPLDAVRFPAGGSRVKLELAGHRTVYDLLFNRWMNKWEYHLHPEGSIPEEMVAVPGGEFHLFLPGIDHLSAQPTRDSLMDRHETTNREYKRFVDAGGYESAEHWPTPLVKEGRELSWEDAMVFFTDSTGRPGPATWEVGDFPQGHDDYPVSGVSWYEAAAYAHWAGKSLPTVFHWNQAALTWAAGEIIPLSNLGTDGPAPVESLVAMHRYGVFGMAGNVREWVFNATSEGGQRFILGGGWNDQPYSFNDAYAQSAWDRSPSNGLRCIQYLRPEDETAELTRIIDRPIRDFYTETPASDETFAIWLKQYDYDPTPLNATVEAQEEYEAWTRETITFDAAYGDERMMAHLFLPKTGSGPFETIVHFPGSGAIHAESSAEVDSGRFDFLLKSGRAVMFPIYKGTYERGDDLNSDYPDETNFYKEHVIMWSKDLSRSIDYLETRDDLDIERLAYYGVSWGGVMGAILPAIEKRIKINVLYVAGLLFQRALPEVDQFHYVSRVTVPTVMINGEFDFFFPIETSQKPFYDLLGTPMEHKRYVVYPGSHSVPRQELIKEVLAWLDRYSKPS
jgi:formylglycine-generating enzyme required for sulfatase activity/dienelactone hydrolase